MKDNLLKIGRNILAAFSINLIWIILILLFFNSVLNFSTSEIYKYIQGMLFPGGDGSLITTNNYTFRTIFFSLIFAPVWEELLFRFFPFEIYKLINKKELLIPIVCFSSIIFGWLHGSVINILIQGVSGVFLSWVYLSNNGGYWGSVISHALWNTMIIFGLPFISELILI